MAKQTKPKPVVKSISFTKEFDEALAHLNKQRNASDYVCNLIRKDRLGSVDNIDKKIQNALKKHLANFMAPVPEPPKPKEEKPVIKTEVVKEEEIVVDDDTLSDYL